jgi:hypothetical protein
VDEFLFNVRTTIREAAILTGDMLVAAGAALLLLSPLLLAACAPSLCGVPYTEAEDRHGVEHRCATLPQEQRHG